jgi:HAD superfamily hydrolase (TIGR01549 family)
MGGRGAGVTVAARRIFEQWAINHHFEIYDDVADVLATLVASGYVIGAISNSHRSLAAFTEHFKLADMITTVVSSAEHGYMKPHPSIFEAALARAGVVAAESLMVGDSLKSDIKGALSVGMGAVLLRRSGDIPQALPPGVTVIRSLLELPPLLQAARS